jgi:ABC-type multidrug transport system ATPase subunit
MIRYEGFTKQFGGLVAVCGLDLEVGRGETLALIGPNGSGKTTTLKAALGLVRSTAGRVLVESHDVATDGRAARAVLGYLPQRLAFPDGCTARELMRFYARLRSAPDSQVAPLLERVGLDDAAGRNVDGFSGGMRQRLGLAIALLGRSRALVLDEPSAALDPTGALFVRDVIDGIRQDGTTVFLSSHDLTEVAALADRVGVFVRGRLVALGTPKDLVRALGLPAYLRVGVGATRAPAWGAAEQAGARRIVWEGEELRCEVEPGHEAAVLEALRQSGAIVTEISVKVPDLEDVYRALTLRPSEEAA